MLVIEGSDALQDAIHEALDLTDKLTFTTRGHSRTIPGEWVIPPAKPSLGHQNPPSQSLGSVNLGNQNILNATNQQDPVILYLHGGYHSTQSSAHIFFSSRTHRVITNSIAIAAQCPVFVPDYRLCPETPFPGAIEDAVACYLALIQPTAIPNSKCTLSLQNTVDPRRVFLMGDSSGAALALQLLHTLAALSLPLPAGLCLISPLLDHELKSPSWHKNWNSDFMSLDMAGVAWALEIYSNGLPLSHPCVSPLYSTLKDLPPILVQAGDSEVV